MHSPRILLFGALATFVAAAPANAGSAPFTYRAVVGKFGILGRHSDGATGSQLVARGIYTVDFPSDVSNCTIVASLGRATTAGGQAEKPGYISATTPSAGSSQVLVETNDMTNRPRDYAFHLILGCP
jgi:hypothetical protein